MTGTQGWTLADALRQARASLRQATLTSEERRRTGSLVAELDRLLAEIDPATAATAGLTSLENSIPSASDEIEALRRETERLAILSARERGLLDAVLNHSPHGIIISDPTGRLVLQNRAAERIWAGSATAADVEGWGRYRAFHPDGRPFEPGDWSMARCLTSGETVETEEVHFQRFDGTHGMLLGSCAPIFGDDSVLKGAVSIFADITRFKQVEQLKDRWVALAGHEMRSPLSVLSMRVEMARRQNEHKQPIDFPQLINVLGRQVSTLTRMVDDMLDVSRAQAGTLLIELTEVPLQPLVMQVAEPLVQGSPRHRLHVDAQPVTARADRTRTEQVVANLVGKAVRYSPDGGAIELRVRTEEGMALIEVRDQGVGFDPAAASRLFEPFLQLKPDGSRKGGLGLGLYLARELVTQMGGRIWAASPGPGRGATFQFTLPLAANSGLH